MQQTAQFIISLIISLGTGALLGYGAGSFIGQQFAIANATLMAEILGGLLGGAFGYDIFARVTLAILNKADDPNPIVRETSIPAFAAVAGIAWGLKRGWFVGLPISIGAAIGFLFAGNLSSSVGYKILGSLVGALFGWVVVGSVGAVLGWLIGFIFVLPPHIQGGTGMSIGDKLNKGRGSFDWAKMAESDIKTFLDRGGDVNHRDKDGGTALMAATRFGSQNLVAALLKRNADVNATDSDGVTALMIAARGYSNPETNREDWSRIGMMLLGRNADVNIQKKDGWSALMFWSQAGDAELVRYLLAKGADVNAKSRQGVTSLMAAAVVGHSEVVQILLENGADPNAKANGKSALQLARWKRHHKVIRLLENVTQ